LGQHASREAQRLAAAILEVLGGARTPAQAAQALGVSLPRYFQVESRAMHALVAACEARPRGRGPSAERAQAALAQQVQRLERELHRQQALVRLAQRSVGLAPAKVEPHKTAAGKRKRRRPVARALRAAEQLLQQSQAPEPTPVPATPAPGQ
jgi:hypothetical protein